MKIEIIEKNKELAFPKLMISKNKNSSGQNQIILVCDINGDNICGTIVNECTHYIGYYSEGWLKEAFEDFNGKLTLSNN